MGCSASHHGRQANLSKVVPCNEAPPTVQIGAPLQTAQSASEPPITRCGEAKILFTISVQDQLPVDESKAVSRKSWEWLNPETAPRDVPLAPGRREHESNRESVNTFMQWSLRYQSKFQKFFRIQRRSAESVESLYWPLVKKMLARLRCNVKQCPSAVPAHDSDWQLQKGNVWQCVGFLF